MLERDLYLLVCLAFNHWHTGIEDPSLYPQCVLAIHSSKRLLVEQINPPPFLLADAIISLTLTKGQRHEGREGMTAYYLTKVIHIVQHYLNYPTNVYYTCQYSGLGWPCCDGGEPTRKQMDTRKVRLSGELQRGVYSWRTKDCRFGASFATVIFEISFLSEFI